MHPLPASLNDEVWAAESGTFAVTAWELRLDAQPVFLDVSFNDRTKRLMRERARKVPNTCGAADLYKLCAVDAC
jgi:hypothetical protein